MPTIIAGKLVAVQFVHRQVGVELPMKNYFVKSVKAGVGKGRRTARGGDEGASSCFVDDAEEWHWYGQELGRRGPGFMVE